MDCVEVKELLSAYYDGELSSSAQDAVARHVEECDTCSGELARFESLSAMAANLDMPAPRREIWLELQRQLDEEGRDEKVAVKRVGDTSRSSGPIPRFVGLAATVLLAVGMGVFGYSTWFGHGEHTDFTDKFGHYLEQFNRDPDSAQQFLLAQYENQRVDAERAIVHVGYRPAVAKGLPDGYTVATNYVMNMPCCTCVQSICERSDGSTFAIFEHDDEETKEWFGDRKEMSTICSGKKCTFVEMDDYMAVTWKRDNRHITVVGTRDLVEVNQLVAWFDERQQS